MYIAVGTPTILSSRTGSSFGGGFEQKYDADNKTPELSTKSIITMLKAPNQGLFATITSNSVSLWKFRPEVVLSTVVRSENTILEDGENVDILWKPDGTALAVTTTKGHIHFYNIVSQPGSWMLQYVFNSNYSNSYASSPANEVQSCYLRFELSLEIDSGIQCGVGLNDCLLVCTSSPPSIVALSWTGEASLNGTTHLSNVEMLKSTTAICEISYSPFLNLFSLLTAEGNVFLASKIVDEKTSKMKWKGIEIYHSNDDDPAATTVCFNPVYRYIAIGNDQGVIQIYELSTQADYLATKKLHSLAIRKPGKKKAPIKLSAVTSLSWSSDGYALACSWETGGYSVWSVYGCLLSSTVSEDTFVHASDGIVSDAVELFFRGIQTLFWDPHDHFLFLLPFLGDDLEMILDIYVLEFAKSSILTSLSNLQNRHVCLIASDRLLIYNGISAEDSNAVGMDPLDWINLQLPPVYIASNWPIKFAIANKAGNSIAVAGQCGFAHYSLISEKWKLFGSEHEEQGFQVTCMQWLVNFIIVGCKNLRNNDYEIRVYSRDDKLDDNHIIHTEKMTHEVKMMNLASNSLLLFCDNCEIYSYLLFIVDGPSIVFQLKQRFSLKAFIGEESTGMQAICRFRTTEDTPESLSKSPVMILRNGTLHMIWKREEGWFASRLAGRVEHFWLAQHKIANNELQRSIWVLDGKGVKILKDPSMIINKSADSKLEEAIFEIDLDFSPLGSIF